MVAGLDTTNDTLFDKQLTVFSPEGKLLQVEYAFTAIKNCPFTSIGIRTEDGVVLISHKNIVSKLIDPDFVNHVRPITEKMGCTFAGHSPDCNYMHLNAVHESIKFFDKYGRGFDVLAATKKLNAINQANTQSPRMRILAASFLIAGIERQADGRRVPILSQIDPAGYYVNMNAFAIGKHQKDANLELEKSIGSISTIHDSIKVGIKCLTTVLGNDIPPSEIEVGYLTIDDDDFKKLSDTEIDEYMIQIEKEDE